MIPQRNASTNKNQFVLLLFQQTNAIKLLLNPIGDVISIDREDTFIQTAHMLRPDCFFLHAQKTSKKLLEFIKILKKDITLSHIPLLIGIEQENHSFLQKLLSAGADEYVLLTFPQELLCTRIKKIIIRSKTLLHTNPLTYLPSGEQIKQELSQRLDSRQQAVLYIDINSFKQYNDTYGFDAGNAIIKKTAMLLHTALKLHGSSNDFLGHIGGDDFIILTHHNNTQILAHFIKSKFANTHNNLSLSIAIATNESLSNAAQLSQKLASIMKKEKCE